MWSLSRFGRAGRGCPSTRTAAKQGKADASAAAAGAVPPQPPTVAPKAAPERKPKVRSAYRRQKQSTEERRQQLQEQQAAQQQLRAGHEEVLSPEAMAAKAAAVQADRAISQKWLKHVVQPVTDFVPALLQHHSISTSSSRAGGTVAAASIPTLLVIDGYNLLHQHSSTKQLIAQDQIHEAQNRLHYLLREYTQQQQRLYALVVYDAHSVSSRSSSTRQDLSSRVTAVYQAGQEADTVIIKLVESLLNREASAAAQGHIGLSTPPFCTLVVQTNDNRIQSAVTDAAVAAAKRKHPHVVNVRGSSSTQLSADLQQLENKLHGRQQQQQWAGSVGVAYNQPFGLGQLPDPQQDTEAWARAYLARTGVSSSSSSWDSVSEEDTSSSSSSRRRRRRLTQQQQQQLEDEEAQRLAAGLSDEQLLQMSAAGGAVVAGAVAVSVDGDGVVPGQAAAAAAAAAEATAAAEGGVRISSSSSTSQQLDDLLNMDLDSYLNDL